jgi:hypothetical protein
MSAILLSGPAGSGKDTIAKYLFKNYGYRRFAIADSLKDVMHGVLEGLGFDILRSDFDDISKKDTVLTCSVRTNDFTSTFVMSPRDSLVKIGNNVIRSRLGPDVFVRSLLHDAVTSGCPRIVITDIRYNEDAILIRDCLSEHGYEVRLIKLVTGPEWAAGPRDVSEDIDDFDAEIRSVKGDIDNLYRDIEKLL